MHHALKIQEILLNIFGHCYPPGSQRETSGLAALARTCRTFKESALDVLWEELDDMSPLARCLPEASHRLFPGNKYSLRRPLTKIEWDILRSYTRRVRSMLDLKGGLDEKSLTMLSNPPTTEPLLPNLRYLYTEYTTKIAHLMRRPFPSLISLNVYCEDPHWLQDSLRSFARSSPDLKRLSLYVGQSDITFSLKFVSDCIRRWRNLRTVICDHIALDVDALVHLSRTSALSWLEFSLRSTLPASHSPLAFSNLHTMKLRSEFLDPISQLLFWIRLPALTDFTAFIDRCPSRQELSSLWSGVQTSGAGRTIKKLRLHHSSFPNNGREPEALLLNMGDLRPCMAFTNLRCMDLNAGWDVGLADRDLLALASAWPRLEKLFINDHWGWNTRGGITPDGVVQLLQKCRSLNEISLVIDTRGYTRFLGLPENLGSTFPHTFGINVLDSTIQVESVLAMATFFASIALRSKFSFVTWDSVAMVQPPGWEVHKARWEDVRRRVNDGVRLRS